MTVLRIGDWIRASDALLAPRERNTLDALDSLHTVLAADHAATRVRLALRLRRSKSRAVVLGRRQAHAAVAAEVLLMKAGVERAWETLEEDILEAVMSGIGQVLERFPQQGLLAAQIRRCVLASRQQEVVRIYVHPDQLADGEALVREIEAVLNFCLCEVLALPTLRPGSCVFETRSGVIDGSLNAQLDAIHDGIRAACERLRPRLSTSENQEGPGHVDG